MLWKSALNISANLENSTVATGLEKVSFHSNPQKWQCQRILRLPTTKLHLFHVCKVMLKILQARLQRYVNRELPDVQTGFRKSRGSRDQIANIHWIIDKTREFQKNIYLLHWLCLKPLTVWITTNWKILKEVGIPEHLTCLLRNLYASQEGTVRTGLRTTDWFKIGKGVRQGCILSLCLFNLYAEYIIRNAGLDDS